MNVSRVSQWMCCALLAVLVGGFGNRTLGQGGGGDAPPLLDAKRMRLQPEEMVAPLKIFGDSSKEGFYIVQLMGYGPVKSLHFGVDGIYRARTPQFEEGKSFLPRVAAKL